MKSLPKYPSLYQINIRVWLNTLSNQLQRKATLDDIPDKEIDQIAEMGFDWVWLLSVWTTSQQSRKVSLEIPALRSKFETVLPDLCDDDIGGSGFAIKEYKVTPVIGGEEELAEFRKRLRKRNIRLMLDFVPNHMGLGDTCLNAECFIHGTAADIENSPQNYTRVQSNGSVEIFAHGRDPYFDGWTDTFQIDYSNPLAAAAMKKELISISKKCDGVRCDMAMLILPEVFENTWRRAAIPFWPDVIQSIHEENPEFCFIAEVYWDMEWKMQQLGFNYAYDKRLYDRLIQGNPVQIREHFYADGEYQDKLARFLENHDEPRAAKEFDHQKHKAAAVITYFSPGLRFFHQGQFEGCTKHISPHLVRAPGEPVDSVIYEFYQKLLSVLMRPVFRNGAWKLLECLPAWEGNPTYNNFLAFYWEKGKGKRALVVVNYAGHNSQCYVRLPLPGTTAHSMRLSNLMGNEVYDRDSIELSTRGLYLDMPPWGYHVFDISEP